MIKLPVISAKRCFIGFFDNFFAKSIALFKTYWCRSKRVPIWDLLGASDTQQLWELWSYWYCRVLRESTRTKQLILWIVLCVPKENQFWVKMHISVWVGFTAPMHKGMVTNARDQVETVVMWEFAQSMHIMPRLGNTLQNRVFPKRDKQPMFGPKSCWGRTIHPTLVGTWIPKRTNIPGSLWCFSGEIPDKEADLLKELNMFIN